MIDLTILASTPSALRGILQQRNVVKSEVDESGKTVYSGTLPGLDLTWNTVPNPVVKVAGVGTDPTDPLYVPPIMDDRLVYLIRMSAALDEADEDRAVVVAPEEEEKRRFLQSKLARHFVNNGIVDAIRSADRKNYRTWRLGTDLWLVHPDDAPAFGVWQ